ncbi:MAG: TusE/DsrC/DsvC family sulfur relay protein [Gammaproteobacteria bacterium]|nr:TusE/DsrC/DsvC family sulfur relay protein [Gammaproteobacteria bacterium]
MSIEVDGNAIAMDANGYLSKIEDWTEKVAEALAADEGIELTEKHWDLINYLRDEYINNGGNQPNNRTINKTMQDKWPDVNVDSKFLYTLFPGNPSKQAGRIGGLPESRRKGGY